MAPQEQPKSWVLYDTDVTSENNGELVRLKPTAENRKFEIMWLNVFLMGLAHVAGVYGFYLFLFESMWTSNLFAVFLYLCSGLGVTAGAHRLWSHKAYKAKLPLRILLTIFNTISYQEPILYWARDHRTHHKYSDTDADPHNATRGFFFSHVGWLFVKKHPEIMAKSRNIDISDLTADPILRFQKKYYKPLMVLLCFLMPTYVPTLWGEPMWKAFFVCTMFRFVYVLNVTWLVNSAGHMWGKKPYDKVINPVENKLLSLAVLGEAFHNYHHTFPWDYKTAELGGYSFNFSKLFIDFMAIIGWAYDLKTVSTEVIQKRVKRTGDGSHTVWGWDDKDMPIEDKYEALIVNPEKNQ